MSEIDLEDLLNGKLSVWCQNTSEVLHLRDLLSKYGVDVSKIHGFRALSIRVEPRNRTPSAEYTGTGPEWHVRNGFVQRWMSFAEFWAACGLADPQISITTLEGLL